MQSEITRALDAAMTLVMEGRRCFPCFANKRPATPRGFKDAAGERDGVRELWGRYPAPLVGVATGEISDIDALDIDSPRHPAAATWFSTLRQRLPSTRIHCTRSGGIHLIFRHRPGLRSWAGRLIPGVDGRGDGGYIIWWPAAGIPVLWDSPPAPWPLWALSERWPPTSLGGSPRSIIPDEHALISLVRKIAGAGEGERNSLAFWAACRAGEMVASGLISADTAAAVIANAAILSGLSRAEAERTAWSGIRTGLGSRPHA